MAIIGTQLSAAKAEEEPPATGNGLNLVRNVVPALVAIQPRSVAPETFQECNSETCRAYVLTHC